MTRFVSGEAVRGQCAAPAESPGSRGTVSQLTKLNDVSDSVVSLSPVFHMGIQDWGGGLGESRQLRGGPY